MPKNTKKGKNAKNKRGAEIKQRPLLIKTEGQEYAQVTRVYGNGRFECKCSDDKIRMGIVRGVMRGRKKKFNLVTLNCTILLSLRDFDNEKADIVHVYKDDEVKRLRKRGEITAEEQQQEDEIVFDIVQEESEAETKELDFDTI